MGPKARRAAALKAAQEIIDNRKAAGGAFTDEELDRLDQLEAEVKECDAMLEKSANADAMLARLKGTGAGDNPSEDKAPLAKSLGDHWARTLQSKGYTNAKSIPAGVTVGAPELVFGKAATDVQAVGGADGAYGPMVTEVDRDFVMPLRNRLMVEDLFQSGTLTGNTIKYPVFGPLEGGADWVAEGGLKPQLHVADPTWVTDSLKEVAGWFKTTDDMAEDMAYMVSEINTTAVYDLSLKKEQGLLFGDGTGNTLLGIANRSGVQAATSTTETLADDLLKAMNKVQLASGFTADAVVINPQDYEALRLSKDGNNQYYGGGFFQGQYGNGAIMADPPIWGRRTVVTTAVPAGTQIVGAFNTAKVFGKGGIRVESTNSNVDDFINDKITTRLRQRIGLQVKYPAAFVVVTAGV